MGELDELLREAALHRAQADRQGALDAATLTRLVDSPFTEAHAAVEPARNGSSSLSDLIGAVADLATRCPSAAWVAGVFASASYAASYLAPPGRAAVWRSGPRAPISAALVTAGEAELTDGGRSVEVSGAWDYVTAADSADFVLVATKLNARGNGTATDLIACLPRDLVEITETWSGIGMRATASHSIRAERATISRELTFRKTLLDQPRPDYPLAVPLRAIAPLFLAAPIVGAAEALRQLWLAEVRRRYASQKALAAAPDAKAVWETTARVTAELDLASRLVRPRLGTSPRALVAQGPHDAAVAAQLASSAAALLVRELGTAAWIAGSEAERLWRDIQTAASHGTLRWRTKAPAVAELELWGEEPAQEGRAYV